MVRSIMDLYFETSVGVVRWPLESWWRQPTFRRVYADHLSLWPRARRVLVWVTVSQPPTKVVTIPYEVSFLTV